MARRSQKPGRAGRRAGRMCADDGGDEGRAAPGGRRRRRGAVGGPAARALALVLVALIGLGSRAPLWNIGGPPQLADPSSYSGDLVIVAFALLVVVPFVIRAPPPAPEPASEPDPELPPVRASLWVRTLAILADPGRDRRRAVVISTLPARGKRPEAHTLRPRAHGCSAEPPARPRASSDALVGLRAARARADRRRSDGVVLPRPAGPAQGAERARRAARCGRPLARGPRERTATRAAP